MPAHRALFTPAAKVHAAQACGLFSGPAGAMDFPSLSPPCCWLSGTLALTNTADLGLGLSLAVWVGLLTDSALGYFPLWRACWPQLLVTFCVPRWGPPGASGSGWEAPSWGAVLPQACAVS